MGTWGSGNFDNDHALDYLAQVCEPLVEKLTDIVENPSLAEADEDGWIECLVAVEILTLLSKQYTSEKLTPQLITDCRDTVLTEWLASIDDLNPDPDHKAERPVVIKESFDKLLAAVQKWQPTS
ncbi:MAG: DUF4259 domain-containing protein [Janthinobacterium lividum]